MDKIDRLQEEVQQKQEILDKKKEEMEQLEKQLDTMERDFNAVKGGKLLSSLRKGKRMLRNGAAYATGRRHWRNMFRSTKIKRADKQIKRLKYKLYEQGFTKKALKELETAFRNTDNRYLRQKSGFELALWHANKYTKYDAHMAKNYVIQAMKGVKNKNFRRRASILLAECYDQLGEKEQGKKVIKQQLSIENHIDLNLAMANLQDNVESRIEWINKALQIHGISPIYMKDRNFNYDSLWSDGKKKKRTKKGPKVSIIIPVYNAEDGVQTAIESILHQTWTNLEVLVVDDCSTDNTVKVVKEYCEKDNRVKLLSTGTNSGPYVARNIALKEATGDFVTINDADDWSHPDKIKEQVTHLVENPSVIANTSQQARLTENLKFYRRGKPGEYVFANMSSLMFRREPVMEKLGYWDPVRFGADGEFKHRLKRVFGKEAVVDLKTGPYSFQRQSSSSLTGNSVFGYHGFFMGARKEYAESYHHHQANADSLYYPFPQEKRLFPVPEPMWPKREEKKNGTRHFDVIIASEFRLLGGTNMSNIEEIKAQKQLGLKTGIVQLNRYDLNSVKEINPKVRELIDGDQVQMLVYGEKVTCDVLIVRHPPILQDWQKYVPEISAKTVRVIINQPPKRDYSEKGHTLYDLKTCVKNVKHYFGQAGIWYPIGPSIREALYEHHAHELDWINLSHEDWVNIINVDEWYRGIHEPKKPIRIGRHSRDQYVKWPADKNELLSLYPDSKDYEIHVLGGANSPAKVLGGNLPSNWHVLEFGEVEPKEFLKTIDVFVYYTHPDWVEAFGRVIFEAMAAGVPVIIPPIYKDLFGDAAIYAEPKEVRAKMDKLVSDKDVYQEQVEKALEYVERHFGYSKHKERLKAAFVDKLV